MVLLNKIIWSIAIGLIIINSIYFSIKLKGPQFRLFKIITSIKRTKQSASITPFDTLVMTLSSKIGVGSLSGAALSIYYGGIGTIFWMFISSFFLSIINYLENMLSIIYKDNKINKSGPFYYIRYGLNKKNLSVVYAILILITYTFLFSSIQTNTITTISYGMYSISKVFLSLLIVSISGIIILKGIKTISNICNKIFPIMMLFFIIVGIVIIVKTINDFPIIISEILKEEFNIKAISGGIIYTVIIAFQRCVFACEAGVGTSAIIAGTTESKNYKLQANLGLIQTYFINFIILGILSFIIITSNVQNISIINGIELTREAFRYHLGNLGDDILLIILSLFSFSTIITVYNYIESSIKFLTKSKKVQRIFLYCFLISLFFGGIITATIIWKMIDIMLGIITIINMYAIYKLRKIIILKAK